MNVTSVVVALIWDNDKFMICQRPETKSCALLWEFVGGKVEPGETKEQALIRECQEELGITVSVGDIFTEVVHEYAAISSDTPKLLEHNDLKWITPSEIPNYTFCPADKDILKLITEVSNENNN